MPGDVEVGRNIDIGGKATIAGSATISGGLKVTGWLEAVNIKGPNKGIFLDVASLRSTYPTPQDGWFAGVGASTPFTAYIGSGGAWVATGGTIQVTVDMSEYTAGVENLTNEIDAIKGTGYVSGTTLKGLKDSVDNHTQQLTSQSATLTTTTAKANLAADVSKQAREIPTAFFAGILESATITDSECPTTISEANLRNSIYYVSIVHKFVCLSNGSYYTGWNDGGEEAYMNESDTAPLLNKLYAKSNGQLYYVAYENSVYTLTPIMVDLTSITSQLATLTSGLATAKETAGAASLLAGASHFNGVVEDETDVETGSASIVAAKVYYLSTLGYFVAKQVDSDTYYDKWNGCCKYNDTINGILDKLYIDDSSNRLYHRDTEGELVDSKVDLSGVQSQIASLSTNTAATMAPRLFVNAMKLLSVSTTTDLSSVRTAIALRSDVALYQVEGAVFTFKTVSGWESYQYTGGTWTSDTNWNKFGGSASVGNCYNVTNDVPLAQGYYTLSEAIDAAWVKGYTTVGIQLTFSIASQSWKTYQYVGANSTEVNFKNSDNWIDLAGMSAGSETLININSLVANANVYSSFGQALSALTAYSTAKGITYAKSGLVVTYKSGQRTWSTKQYKGDTVAEFTDETLWQDFGSASSGSTVETSDEPEEDGTDAFSTGGAYENIPTEIAVDSDTAGVVKLQLKNAGGEAIGNEVQFSVGTGSGSSTGGTIVAIAFQSSPLYGALGSALKIRAAIRSVTTVGTSEQDNTIATVALYDRDTNTLLETLNFNRASSVSMTNYTFSIDVSDYFTVAGARRFKLVATDDGGNTGSRNINVTAVDVTVSRTQTLQYTDSSVFQLGGGSKSVSMYRFANNASDQGITAIVEIYLNGSWQELERQIVRDTYSNNITLNPSSCLGQTLTHGVYPIRVHGVDIASSVVGNYLYTGVFVVDSSNTTPLVVMQWFSDSVNGSVQLYESLEVTYAVYDPSTTAPTATAYLDNVAMTTHTAYRSSTYTFTHQVTGVVSDGTVSQVVKVGCGTSYSNEASFVVSGSVIDATLKSGAIYAFDFANRNNSETSHAIASGSYAITPSGMNWSTNGFVPMTTGGEMALRIAEDATATLNHQPFANTDIESNGLGIQFAFAAKNLVDDDTKLIQCYNEGVGAGFYVTGKAVGIYCSTGLSNHVEERFYKQGEKVTVAIVVEPAGVGLGQTRSNVTYYFIKLYLNGEEVAVIGYVSGQSNLIQSQNISFNGTNGDLYLYYMIAWNDYFQFDQAFQNYLVKLTDTEDMVEEYDFEDVMASQSVNELGVTSVKSRPQASSLAAQDMPYVIECPYNGSNVEALDETTSTSTKNYITLFYIDPKRPWTNFRADDVQRRNQGTTSAQRPVKNPRYYLAQSKGSTYVKATNTGGTTITLLNPDNTTELGRRAIALAAINKVQLFDDSIPVDTITIKVDYSDSSNANDCGVCDMMNATFRAVGSQYLTPAQRAFDGTWTKGSITLIGLQMNHSTANFPIAMFRSKVSTGTTPYFHAKGNWKEDKKEQTALGFINTPGYNLGCLNYGDFKEFYGNENETLAQEKARFLASSGLNTTATYILTQYCGSSYIVMNYVGGAWAEQTGSMVQNANGSWTVTGSVMNPVDGFELLNYQGMDWFKGVSSVADMMAASTSFSKWVQSLIDDGSISVNTVPAWTYYFESMLDDADLAIAYALGKKVPYNLYRWMKFCDRCDYDTYAGSDADEGVARLNLWKSDLYKYASPHSCYAYDVFTDYLAAVDQRAKNMQPMWFLEDGCKVVNGVYYNASNEASDTTTGMLAMRMYLNKVYDCDTCNGKDNDGGQTVDAEVDPNKLPNEATGYVNPYAGYNSVLFRNCYLQQTVYIDGNSTELTLKTVASAMRSCTATVNGETIHPFSPEGAQYFFVSARIKRWPKRVSSYDGERKYIDFTGTTANNIYFYALQGLGLTSLPAFIDRRWRIRDGFYGTGDFFSGVLSGRVNSANDATITIKAAKTGYFGIGNDSSGSLSESVYLEAGEEHTFTNFSHEEGALIYIYQADRMSKIDLSQISLSSNFDFSVMTLTEEIILGGASRTNMTIGTYTPLTTVNLGELPFLRVLNIQNTNITNVVCSGCPRVQTLNAAGSQLVRADIADGSKITSMVLPATYQYLKLRYLPNLTLTGLVIANAASITTMIVEQCTNIDPLTILNNIASSTNSALRVVRVTGINDTKDGSELTTLSGLTLTGLDANLTARATPAIVGNYTLSVYTAEATLTAWRARFPDLTIRQAQFTMIVQDDSTSERANVKNIDNNTGYGTDNDYAASGHISKILDERWPVLAILSNNTMQCKKLRKTNYSQFADGTTVNVSYYLNNGYDAFMYEPHYWYKGINDFKNQLKYTAFSSLASRPLSTANTVRRSLLSSLTPREGIVVAYSAITVGESTLESSGVLTTRSGGYNTYEFDVEGMKQVRWPGLNNNLIGACFLNAAGVIIGKFNLNINDIMFDFDETIGDYVFTTVPDGAKTFVFTAKNTNTGCEVIAVDSSEVEAIEPDWVEHKECLVAIYECSVDNSNQLHSMSGQTVRVGTGTHITWHGWAYNADGTLNTDTANGGNIPTQSDTLNYTCKDFQNLAYMRGDGYQLFDYEMSKDVAMLTYAKCGDRDGQRKFGTGKTSGGSTGYLDSIGAADSAYSSGGGNKVLGYESFMSCTYEWMDRVALNVVSYKNALKNLMVGASGDPVNAVWNIYDPASDSERTVQGTTTSGQTVARTRHGRYCDIIASKFTGESNFASHYADGQYYTGSTCRVVGRAGVNAHAGGGLAYAYAIFASSYSNTSGGSRLAFRPLNGQTITFEEEDE